VAPPGPITASANGRPPSGGGSNWSNGSIGRRSRRARSSSWKPQLGAWKFRKRPPASLSLRNVWETIGGLTTNVPAGARMTLPAISNVISPSIT
jgi:hypothetical protein